MKNLRNATLENLTAIGFTNILKPTSDGTWDAMCEQIDNGKVDGVKLLDAVRDEFPSSVGKDNYLNSELSWLENQVDRLHPTD